MISKCLWKMYQKPDGSLGPSDRKAKPPVGQLIEALEHTIDVVTAMPKSRHSEPILEPHYKILSIVHKLVQRKDLTPQEGAEILSRQPYGLKLDGEISDMGDWEEYLIKNLRHLRDKDKSNWQHRMIVRHARLLFDEEAQESGDYMQAKAAFGVLRESMFTKTMVMNVWKCDAERPGRHHVFTEQYVRFMVKILVVMNDRVSLESLLRRIRKKGGDFYHFTDLWQTCCHAYLRLLRQTHKVEQNEEDRFKSVLPEEYEIMTDRIGDWASEQGSEVPVLQCMKEAIELKKLNGGLMKAGAIDDLICDAYTAIYFNIAPTLPGPDPSEVIEMRAKERAKEEAQADQPNGEKQPIASASDGNAQSGREPANSGEATDKQPETAPRRKTGIRRADVLRKAEQAYLRSTERPKSVGPGATNGKSRVGSTASAKRGSPSAHGDDDDARSDTPEHDKAAGHDGTGDGQDQDVAMKDEEGESAPVDATAASSRRVSVHDSADDESDLSDIPEGWDEEPPPSLMFPNLRRSSGPTVTVPSSPEKSENEEAEGREGDEEEHEEGEGHGGENEEQDGGGDGNEDEGDGGGDEDGNIEEGQEGEEAHDVKEEDDVDEMEGVEDGGHGTVDHEPMDETVENLEEGVDDGADETMEDAEEHAEDDAEEEVEEEVGEETEYEAEEEEALGEEVENEGEEAGDPEAAEEADEDAEEEAEGDADDEEEDGDDEEAEEDSRELEESGSEDGRGGTEQDEAGDRGL